MARILRGKRKGQQVLVHQWCNDWVSTDQGIFGITGLIFTDEEIFKICGHDNNGMMFGKFEVVPFKNRFRRRAIKQEDV